MLGWRRPAGLPVPVFPAPLTHHELPSLRVPMPTRLKVQPAFTAAVAVIMAALLSGSCSPAPFVTRQPGITEPSVEQTLSPATTDEPFRTASWPASGSACDRPGYTGLLGRIEATAVRTVRFTLCRPDAAFLARLAHPALGILDTTSLDRLAADRSSATALAGSGPYRIDHWTPGDNVRLVRVAPDPSPDTRADTIVLRWSADPAVRTNALQSAAVDGIDDPGSAALDRIATLPELTVTPRVGLAMTYLAFGRGPGFGRVAVRRAIAHALDRDALVAAAFPAGSVTPTHVAPCAIPDACDGKGWYEFNGPAAAAALAAAGFDLASSYQLHIPDQPLPGLPDPGGVAAAVQTQLASSIGMRVEIDTMPAADYGSALAAGSLDGLYLGGVTSPVPDAGVFLEPLFGHDVNGMPARRAGSVADDLDAAAATTERPSRMAAFTHANDTIRDLAVIVPLANPGSVAVFRSDVKGVATAPLGLDPLAATTPADRKQVVFMQSTEPRGAYCGDQSSDDAYRLCALASEGLYGLDVETLAPVPRLAQRCTPNSDASVWTCRLRASVTFQDGASLDAGDVLASFVAQWDESQPLRRSDTASFGAWDALFGGPLGGG